MITIALLAFMVVGTLAWLLRREQVSWAGVLWRVGAGRRDTAEWVATPDIMSRVQADYLAATNWMQDASIGGLDADLAPSYLCEDALARFVEIGTRCTDGEYFRGVLRADHNILVRCFAEHGDRCVVLDNQCERRMATYEVVTGMRIMTQAFEDAVLVYEMAYDFTAGCWKIAKFVQQLPAGWGGREQHGWLRVQVDPLERVGRDN